MADLGHTQPASRSDGHAAPLADGNGLLPRSIEAMLAEATSLDLVQSELRHRFRNMVAVAQSLVSQTLQDGVPIAQARDTLNQRLAAMGTAVDLLLQNDWQPASLRMTLRDALALHCGFHDRIHCEGPDVTIGSNAVLTLTLAMHELGTNAIKYGALSVPDGTVDLCWNVVAGADGPLLWMQWAEHGGPPVTPPVHNGFGSRLILKATGRALGGEVKLEYVPSGVTWLLKAPLARIAH